MSNYYLWSRNHKIQKENGQKTTQPQIDKTTGSKPVGKKSKLHQNLKALKEICNLGQKKRTNSKVKNKAKKNQLPVKLFTSMRRQVREFWAAKTVLTTAASTNEQSASCFISELNLATSIYSHKILYKPTKNLVLKVKEWCKTKKRENMRGLRERK